MSSEIQDRDMSRPELRQRRRKRGGGRDNQVVPDVEFRSYYGRPVVKASPWEADIPAYLFLGGLAAGSSLLGAGGDLTGRTSLRRVGRLGGLVGISLSFAALVHDLGRPSRFINMLRVAKPTSPMSMGTWLLTGYGPLAGLAGAAELVAPLARSRRAALSRPARSWPGRFVQKLARPAGLGAAVIAPAVASYTAVLLSDTATPSWNEGRREMPFVFVGSAASAAGGLAMVFADPADTGPARRLATVGAIVELAAEKKMESSMGLAAEPMHSGSAGKLMRASRALTAFGVLASLGAGRRPIAVVAGSALLAGSICTRFGIFAAGQASAEDPRYTVVPQRERMDATASLRA